MKKKNQIMIIYGCYEMKLFSNSSNTIKTI